MKLERFIKFYFHIDIGKLNLFGHKNYLCKLCIKIISQIKRSNTLDNSHISDFNFNISLEIIF